MPGGRPTKCTPEVAEEFRRLMSAGNYFETACDFIGVHKVTAYRWINRAEEALLATVDEEGNVHEDQVPEGEQVFVAFRNATCEGAAQAEIRNLAIVQQSARDRTVEGAHAEGRAVVNDDGEPVVLGDWRAAAWWLEKRKQDTWGERKQKVTLTGAGDGPVQVQHGLDPDSIAGALAGLLARTGDEAGAGASELDADTADD